MPYIGKTPTAVPITSNDLADNIVTTAKINADAVTSAKLPDDVISEEHLDPTIITALTEKGTPVDADKLIISDSADSNALKYVQKSNLGGGVNTPYFFATLTSEQQISDNTNTKVTFTNEILDSASAFDNSSNYRFTPQTAGKYFVACSVSGTAYGLSVVKDMLVRLYKNGSAFTSSRHNASDNGQYWLAPVVNSIVTMNGSSDYIEVYATLDVSSAQPRFVESAYSWFMAYKIIE